MKLKLSSFCLTVMLTMVLIPFSVSAGHPVGFVDIRISPPEVTPQPEVLQFSAKAETFTIHAIDRIIIQDSDKDTLFAKSADLEQPMQAGSRAAAIYRTNVATAQLYDGPVEVGWLKA